MHPWLFVRHNKHISLCCKVHVFCVFSMCIWATSGLKVKSMNYLYNDMASMSLIDISCKCNASPVPILMRCVQ